MMRNALRNGLIERDLGNLVYVGILGRDGREVSFVPLFARRDTARVDIIWDTRDDGREEAINGHHWHTC